MCTNVSAISDSDLSERPETRLPSPTWHANAHLPLKFPAMPPRPIPRPNPTPSGSTPRQQDDDDDALFMRNQGRSLRDVNRRVAQAEALAPKSSSPTGSDEDEYDEYEDTPKRVGKDRKQNTQGKAHALPKWAKKGGILNFLEDSNEEAENNASSAQDDTPSKRRDGGTASASGTPTGRRGTRARSRSRSRSLTPPPDLTLAQKFSAQQAIKNALKRENIHVPAPIVVADDEDDGDDAGGVELDPALQHIAQALQRERAARPKDADAFGSTQLDRPRMQHHTSSSGPPDVNVRVKWVSHPDDEIMQARPQQTWSFVVKRHHSLKELLLQTSEKAHVLAEDIVLMREGQRVFTSVSPDGLGAWDRVELEACDRTTFEALRLQNLRSPTPTQRPGDEDEYNRESSAAPSEASANAGEADNKFKLVLRAQGSKEVTLTVRPTTSCGKIVSAFLAVLAKTGGTVPTSPRKVSRVRLCIDGEKQNPNTPIANCDLEDGDMVEVVGM